MVTIVTPQRFHRRQHTPGPSSDALRTCGRPAGRPSGQSAAGLYYPPCTGAEMAPSAFIHHGVRFRRIATKNGRTINMVDFLTRQYVALQNLLVIESDEEGQGLAEYALILALIAIVAIAALLFLGGEISKILSNIGAAI